MPRSWFFQEKVCRVPTWRGWICLMLMVLGGATVTARFLHGFLAVSAPTGADVLVIEGWLPDYAIERAVEYSREHGYDTLVVTGVDIEKGGHLAGHGNYASLTGSTLRHLGVPESSVIELPAHDVLRNRTYTTALKVKEWAATRQDLQRLDVFTLGPHARRTRLLYRLAMSESCEVGVISCPEIDYDPGRWWATSRGFRQTVGETLAYGYARVLFRP